MKDTGITKKIDELGRIVIPKEIRTNLNIKVNDELGIYIKDNNIVLEKYSKLENCKDFIHKLIKNISKLTPSKVVITDKEKIITTNEYISKDLVNIINNNIDKKETISITDTLKLNSNINIIRDNYCPIGCVIIENNSELDCKLSNFLAEILSNYVAN